MMLVVLLCILAVSSLQVLCLGLAPSGPWDAFNLAPSTRQVRPVSVKQVNGSVHVTGRTGDISLQLQPESWVTLDFGKEIGGWVSFSANNVAVPLQLAFTESPLFIGTISDDSSYPSANMSYDGALDVTFDDLGSNSHEWIQWTMPRDKLRGGFRYLTVVCPPFVNSNLQLNSSTSVPSVRIANLSVSVEFMPHWNGVRDLKDYSGYFYATGFDDAETWNRAWYAGAYTVQTNTVPVNTGRQVPFVNSAQGWLNNAMLTFNISRLSDSSTPDPSTIPIIVDGAKRDRAVWPGDMGIAVPTQFVSTFDLLSTRNALTTMFESQNPRTGALDESGPPLSQTGSDTYHMHTLIGAYNYWLYSGDDQWVQSIWANYTKAVGYLAGRVDQTGLLNVGGTRDWARLGQGGHNAEANALYYRVLTSAPILAQISSLTQSALLASEWLANASALQQTYNALLWDDAAGMYKDNITTTLHPQDGNSFALLYGLPLNETQEGRISAGLMSNWNEIGAVAPELPDTISPFITGFEVQAHFTAGSDDTALSLLNRTWGYMLNTPLSVQSTLLEGYTANGSIWYRSIDGYNSDPAYTSHAHGWSSGATSALTFYVLGLQVVQPGGKTWKVEPHPGTTASRKVEVQGGFETGLGWFGVSWSIQTGAMSINVDVPLDTSGTVILPTAFRDKIVLDGKLMGDVKQNSVLIVDGGKHVIVGYGGVVDSN